MRNCLAGLFLMVTLLAGQGPVGSYVGELQLPSMKLRLGMVLKAAGDGYTAELISLDQGMAKLPLSTLTVEGKAVHMEASAARITFDGTFNDDYSAITGKFTQGMAFDLVFKRVAELPSPPRPQEPKPPFPYTSEDVTLAGGAKDVTLAGTITFPKGAKKLPAIVLVTGSGPQNRNEELFGHKPFLVWADALTRAGFTVLRYDDRGVGASTGSFRTSTSADFAADATAAVAYLRTRPEVDAARVVVMGHSEGGMIAPMVAAADAKLAGIVLLAGTGVKGEAIIRKQIPDLVRAAGAPESVAATQLALFEKQVEVDPWMKYFWSHDPAPVLKQVKCPVLAVNGELDLQVNADVNLEAIRAALESGGNKNLTVRKLAKLNHLLQTATTGAGAEYGKIEETVAPIAITEVTAWLKQTLATK